MTTFQAGETYGDANIMGDGDGDLNSDWIADGMAVVLTIGMGIVGVIHTISFHTALSTRARFW